MSTQDQSIDDAKQRYTVQLGLAAAQQKLDTPCPDDEQLAAFYDHRLQGEEKAIAEAHVAHCAECYAHWRDMVAVLTPESPPAPVPSKAFGWHWLSQPWLSGGLATAMVAILAVLVLLPEPSVDEQLTGLYQQWQQNPRPIKNHFVSGQMKSITLVTNADLAFKRGIHDGLAQITPSDSEYWSQVRAALADLAGDCQPAMDVAKCQTALTLSRQVGQWAAIHYVQCFSLALADQPSIGYWQQQQALAQQLNRLVSDQVSQAAAYKTLLATIATMPISTPAELCQQIERLTRLALN